MRRMHRNQEEEEKEGEKKVKQREEQREEGKGFALLRGKGFALHPAVAEKEDKEEAAGHTAGVLEPEDGPMRAGAPDPGARELAALAWMTRRL